MKRPWWLPEDLDPKGIILAGDQNVVFEQTGDRTSIQTNGIEARLAANGFEVTGPVCLWDRVLTNQEIFEVTHLLILGKWASVLDHGPSHVRFRGDVDEDGTCHCVVCEHDG